MGMLLALTYRMVEADRFTCAGHFKQEQTLALMGVRCPGNTVGLIGLGKVARFMVPRIRAFDMHILYTPASAPRRKTPSVSNGRRASTAAQRLRLYRANSSAKPRSLRATANEKRPRARIAIIGIIAAIELRCARIDKAQR
jgi:lactate dehydrogenase-like 2-hydroxyacid dehydrogenase